MRSCPPYPDLRCAMETIEIECGSCHQVMAVQTEHRGQQVHCPHCQAVILVPTGPGGGEVPIRFRGAEEGESIFADPSPADDLFGSEAGPQVEMPPEGRHAATVGETVLSSSPAGDQAEEAALAAIARPRVPAAGGNLAPMLLIFLIPYAIVATIFAAWLYFRQPGFDPLERLPDPKPGRGGPRTIERVQHDIDLPERLRTGLQASLAVGDIQLTPQEIRLNGDGDLELRLKVRNLSTDLAFVPISDEFLHVRAGMAAAKPYSFLHDRRMNMRLYGGYLDYPGSRTAALPGEIGPGEEETIVVTTLDKYRNTSVPKILASGDRLTWRLQLRRGLVSVRGQKDQVSATAIIGVDFSAREVKKG